MKVTQLRQEYKEKLHGWLITYNQYTDRWQATKRDDKDVLFNDGGNCNNPKMICTTDLEYLITLICTTDEAETV